MEYFQKGSWSTDEYGADSPDLQIMVEGRMWRDGQTNITGSTIYDNLGTMEKEKFYQIWGTECKEIGDTTNIVDEARAILKGLSYCVDHELHPLILETDYMLMKKVVEGDWKIPCVISLKATHWEENS
ncbi:hypothetical protein KY290_017352 [Solanum tuberosum]|uniref:RNase H type-1 domain-containing protein n=1 Tax=Solanum tuberosum TaxID=4113 RepID=A0ABQ7VB10_SOLTU|nr:hypothetical protein KY289_016575 [Solanum tuberosum]KAH0761279.1 hypothetical protein KY290_017352 [Solanum tuberosum]